MGVPCNKSLNKKTMNGHTKIYVQFRFTKLKNICLRIRSLMAVRLQPRVRRDNTITTVLIFIVIIFILCNSLKCGLYLFETITALKGRHLYKTLNTNPTFRLLSSISNIMVALSSAMNFLVYVLKDPRSDCKA